MADSTRAIVGAGAAVASARVFSLVCAAVQLPLLTNLLTPAEYSLVAVAIALSTYFSLVAAEPNILAFQRFPGERSDRRNYRYALTRTSLLLAGVGVVTVGVALGFGQWKIALAIVGWGCGIAVSRLVSTAWLMWAEPWRYSINLMLATGVRTAGLVVLIVVGTDGVIALAAAGMASAIAALVLSPKVLGVRALAQAPWPWRFGVHLAVASLAVTVLTNSALVMLPAFVSNSDVGRFAAMTQVATLTCGAVLGLALTVAYPALRRLWDADEVDATIARLDWLTEACLVTALAAIAVFTVGDYWVIHVVIGPGYVDGAIIPALTISTAFASMGQLSGWFHQFRFEAALVGRRTWASAIVGVVATAIGAWAYGTTGAAVGVALGFLTYYLVLRWRTPISTGMTAVACLVFVIAVVAAALPSAIVSLVVGLAAAVLAVGLGAHLAWRIRAQRS
ncbi:lipopolysaccharide biosynthesis protein [Leifsonia sp. NPDC058292]|uniref:lipopolysaccharide biosynthesis protein n=1 Tax=Leifsonia sp. NPDC058292 TaxID=3346428 RepID=UPI0036DF1969